MARTARSIGIHRIPHTVLSMFALGVCILILSSAVYEPSRLVLNVTLGLYLIILLTSSLGGLKLTRKLSVFPYIPLLLVSLHFSRGLGYLFPWR